MKVFVTGGTGFIGSHVVKLLVASGHQVVALVRGTSRLDRLYGLGDSAIERTVGDVQDAASIRAAMARCDCTAHLAAPSSWENDDPAALAAVIEGGTANVLDAAAALPEHRVVFVSSTAAINASDEPQVFDERAEFTISDPSLHYAHAKHRAELQARRAFERGVPVVIVNPAEVYGPGDTQLVTAGNLIDFATSRPVLVCRGGTGVVHVEDVAAGIVAALERGVPGERYILSGDNLSIRELAELCLELVGRRGVVLRVPNSVVRVVSRTAIRLHVPLPYNPHVVPYATRYWFVDAAKARRDLGVSFRGARDTIASTLQWLTAAGHLRP